MTHLPFDLPAIYANCPHPPPHVAASIGRTAAARAREAGLEDEGAGGSGRGSQGAFPEASGRMRVGLQRRNSGGVGPSCLEDGGSHFLKSLPLGGLT